MKFKIIHVNSSNENESDYETAIDMSHSNIFKVDYTLKAISGLEVLLSYTHIETSYSYYQEEIPDDFKSNDRISYSHHSLPGKSKVSEYGHMEAVLSEKLVILSKEDFFEYFNSYIEKNSSEKYEIGHSSEMGKRLYQFEQQQSGNRAYDNIINIGDKNDVVYFMEKIEGKKQDIWFDVEISENLKYVLQDFVKKNEEINKYNSNNMLEYMTIQANARVSIFVDKLYKQAKIDIGSGVLGSKLKV